MPEGEPQPGDLPWLAEIDAPNGEGREPGALGGAMPTAVTLIIGAAILGASIFYLGWMKPQHEGPNANIVRAEAQPTFINPRIAPPMQSRPPSTARLGAPSLLPRMERPDKHQLESSQKTRAAMHAGPKLPKNAKYSAAGVSNRGAVGAIPGQTIQLAAYASSARAEGEWERVRRSHPELDQLHHEIVLATVRSHTVFRLRAAGRSAHAICEKLSNMGVPCMKVGGTVRANAPD